MRRGRILDACCFPAKSYEDELAHKEKIWENLLKRSEWIKEMGSFLIMDPKVKKADRIHLNLHLHAIAGMKEEYVRDGGWGSFDTALISIASRFDGVNIIASQYPDVVQKYKKIKVQAHQNIPQPIEPKTTFRHTWQGHFRYPLLREFNEIFCTHQRDAG